MLPYEYDLSSKCNRFLQAWKILGVFKKTWTKLLKTMIIIDRYQLDMAITRFYFHGVTLKGGEAMTGGNNPTIDRSKLG